MEILQKFEKIYIGILATTVFQEQDYHFIYKSLPVDLPGDIYKKTDDLSEDQIGDNDADTTAGSLPKTVINVSETVNEQPESANDDEITRAHLPAGEDDSDHANDDQEDDSGDREDSSDHAAGDSGTGTGGNAFITGEDDSKAVEGTSGDLEDGSRAGKDGSGSENKISAVQVSQTTNGGTASIGESHEDEVGLNLEDKNSINYIGIIIGIAVIIIAAIISTIFIRRCQEKRKEVKNVAHNPV